MSKKYILKVTVILLVPFILLFGFRLSYGYYKFPVDGDNTEESYSLNLGSKKNYASSKREVTSQSSDQKLEKKAEIRSQSKNFNKSKLSIYKIIKDSQSVIQFENLIGNKHLMLSIGVVPNNFEEVYNKLIKIGVVTKHEISQSDKTNEFLKLRAKKNSLEKTKAALMELKNKEGKISDLIDLEHKILDIETQLQHLGVSLGDFDQENEFCTIYLSLKKSVKVTKIPLIQRIKVALEWSLKRYLEILQMIFYAAISSFIFVIIIQQKICLNLWNWLKVNTLKFTNE